MSGRTSGRGEGDAAAGSWMALARMHAMLVRVHAACPEDRRPLIEARLRWVESRGRDRYPLLWPPA